MDFKKIATITTIVFTVVAGTSGYLTNGFGLLSKIDARYAKAAELKQLSLKVQWVSTEVKLNHLQQLKSEAWTEYFAAKKLKKKHPNDEEVAKLFEKAVEDKKRIIVEYAEMKKKVEKFFQQLQK